MLTKTGVYTQEFKERKSGNKRYVLYPPVIKLENGNVVIVERVEYYRQTNKLVLQYTDDTELLKQTVTYLSKYYEYMKIYSETGNQTALTQAASFLLKLRELYGDNFDIMHLEQYKQLIINEYKNEYSLEALVEQTKLNPVLIKAVLVLEGKLKVSL